MDIYLFHLEDMDGYAIWMFFLFLSTFFHILKPTTRILRGGALMLLTAILATATGIDQSFSLRLCCFIGKTWQDFFCVNSWLMLA